MGMTNIISILLDTLKISCSSRVLTEGKQSALDHIQQVKSTITNELDRLRDEIKKLPEDGTKRG